MRFKERIKGKKAAVFGLGASGSAAARVLASLGASVTVVDNAESDLLRARAEKLRELGIGHRLGGVPLDVMRGSDLVVVSPGVPTEREELEVARLAGAEVIGELELSYLLADAEFIAITGTKGKSTTTRLVHAILSAAGFETVAGGNLPDEPLCERVMSLSSNAKIVAEVSSFQLETIRSFKPHIACITNLGVDHLDRYPDLAAYHKAKLRVCMNQTESDFLIVNSDDALLASETKAARPSRFFFGVKGPDNLDGVFLSDGEIVLSRDGEKVPLMSRSDVTLPGLHNVQNVMAASAAAVLCGVSAQTILEAMRSFRLSPHTLEVFAEHGGVTFVDDSHATNVLSVTKAIESFDQPIILIVGGRDKGGDFSEILGPAKGKVKLVIAIGEAAPRFENELGKDLDVQVQRGGLDETVSVAMAHARPGDVVLLSPGCSSFDMFADFRDRGRRFKDAVGSYFEKAS